MQVNSYRDLILWQKAIAFVVLVYRHTAQFSKEELYGLTQQLRRAAVAVPSNIAEGQGRQTTRDFLHFLAVARGSLNEAETQLLIAERLGYLANPPISEVLAVSAEVGRLLHGFSNSLKSKVTDH
jgi:four helix bundle protein